MKTKIRIRRLHAETRQAYDERTMEVDGGPHSEFSFWHDLTMSTPPMITELVVDTVGETYEPLQLDLGTLIARLEQMKEEFDARDQGYDHGHWLMDRVLTCDLPRLQQYLTHEMRTEIDEAKK